MGSGWKRVRVFALIAAFVPVILTAQYVEKRSVQGKVTDARGNPLPGAVVTLENTKSLDVRSFISRKDGTYEFHGLNADIDYALRAQYRGKQSDQKTVSKFDSSKVATVDLQIPTS